MKTSRRLFLVCATTVAVAGARLLAPAQDAAKPDRKPPSANEVIAKFVQAIGGKEAVLKHSSTRIKGKWEMVNLGQSGDFELLRAKPNRQVMRIKFSEEAKVVHGYDGKVGWMLNPLMGPMLLEGKMLEQVSEEAEFYSVLREEKNYRSMETVGMNSFDGKDAVELKLVSKSGRETRELYDAKTGLLLQTKGTQESPQGPSELSIAYHDYKKLGDVLQPTRLAVKGSGFEQVLTVSSVEYDSVAEKEFELPDEIKGLLKK